MKQRLARSTPDRRAGGLRRAEVLDVEGADIVLVRLGEGAAAEVVAAEIAVPGYTPAAGDRVVVEPGDGAWFVLGVLGEARRRDALAGIVATAREGGVELRARSGDLTLSAPGRVAVRADGDVTIEAQGRAELRAPEITTTADALVTTAAEIVTQAGRLEVHARRIVEQADDVYRRAEGLMQTQAARARTLIEGAYQLVARRTTITSDEDTVVDGKRVLLG